MFCRVLLWSRNRIIYGRHLEWLLTYSVLSVLRLLKVDFIWSFKFLYRTHFFCIFCPPFKEHFARLLRELLSPLLLSWKVWNLHQISRPSLASTPLGDISISDVRGKQEMKEWAETQEVLESNWITKPKGFFFIAINYTCHLKK